MKKLIEFFIKSKPAADETYIIIKETVLSQMWNKTRKTIKVRLCNYDTSASSITAIANDIKGKQTEHWDEITIWLYFPGSDAGHSADYNAVFDNDKLTISTNSVAFAAGQLRIR